MLKYALIAGLLSCASCGFRWQALQPPPSPPAQGASIPAWSSPQATAKLMIFGGDGHETYLGCLSCSEYAVDSVFNTYGPHGSAYSSESILNHFSEFGSAYSTYSACAAYASDPPVVVDGAGNSYGRLTMNRYNQQGFRNERIAGWLAGACGK